MTGGSFLAAELPAVTRLLERIQAAATPPAAITVFEAALPALPACGSAAPFLAAAQAYDAGDRAHAATLLRGLAAQFSPRGARRSGDATAGIGAAADEVLAHPAPSACLLQHLARLDGPDDPAAAALFEAVLPDLPPIDEYWVHYRMAQVYARLGRDDAAFLLSALALQLEPEAESSEQPARCVLARLLALHAWAEAAAVHEYWLAANPAGVLLDAAERARLAPQAGTVAAKRERPLLAAEVRAPERVQIAGRALHHALHGLQQGATRPAIMLAELDEAVLLIGDGSVSVWTADGTPLPELSVGQASGLMHLRLRSRLANGEAMVERRCDAAVLIGDRFPAPNLCHFLLDQASRLDLYARAGLSLAEHLVVGPDLATPYQREIARRFGVQRYLGTRGHGLLRAGRLAVTSNCHHLRHSAHLGADWALQAIRNRFSDLTAGVRRQRRLFVSRADAAARRLTDEAEILALLQPFGFERITPGALPLAAQVRAFAGATHVVAPHGAALASIAFCAPGTRVLEILHPHYGTDAYAMLAAPLGLDYVAMTGFDGDSDAAPDNDPALAAQRRDVASHRDLRADLAGLRTWLQRV